MRSFLATVVLTLFLAPAVFAGGGNFDDMPQQQVEGKIIVNVDTPPRDNTAIYVGAVATVVTGLGVALIGLRARKKK